MENYLNLKNTTTKHLNQNKMTAVEWLIKQLYSYPIDDIVIQKFNQAKQMEREQIISAHESASLDAGFENSAKDWAEEYYNKLKTK